MNKENLLIKEDQIRWAYRNKHNPDLWLHLIDRGYEIGSYHDSILYRSKNILEYEFEIRSLKTFEWQLTKIHVSHTIVDEL
jgi:hypothetical protein